MISVPMGPVNSFSGGNLGCSKFGRQQSQGAEMKTGFGNSGRMTSTLFCTGALSRRHPDMAQPSTAKAGMSTQVWFDFPQLMVGLND